MQRRLRALPMPSSRRTAGNKTFSCTGLFAGMPAPTRVMRSLWERRAREEARTGNNPSQCCSPARFSSFLQRSDRCTTRNCLPALAYRSRKVFNAAIAE